MYCAEVSEESIAFAIDEIFDPVDESSSLLSVVGTRPPHYIMLHPRRQQCSV